VTFGGRTLENFKMVNRFQKTLDCHQWITVVEILYFPKQVNHCKSTCRGLLVRPGDLLASELVSGWVFDAFLNQFFAQGILVNKCVEGGC